MLPSKCEKTCEKGTIFDNRGQISADFLGWIWRDTVFGTSTVVLRVCVFCVKNMSVLDIVWMI